MELPTRVDCLIIGAGIHGLSTARRPAQRLTEKGGGVGGCILAIDKSGMHPVGPELPRASFIQFQTLHLGGVDQILPNGGKRQS